MEDSIRLHRGARLAFKSDNDYLYLDAEVISCAGRKDFDMVLLRFSDPRYNDPQKGIRVLYRKAVLSALA